MSGASGLSVDEEAAGHIVLISVGATTTGVCFHSRDCWVLDECETQPVSIEEAVERGKRPCSTCSPFSESVANCCPLCSEPLVGSLPTHLPHCPERHAIFETASPDRPEVPAFGDVGEAAAAPPPGGQR